MKKGFSLFIILFITLILCSCINTDDIIDNSGSNKPTLKIIPEFNYENKVVINLWDMFGHLDSNPMQYVIDEFEHSYPNIKVVRTIMGDHQIIQEEVLKLIETGKLPTVIQTYTSSNKMFIEKGIIQELDSYVSSRNRITHEDGSKEIVGIFDAELDNYVDGFLDECRSFDPYGTLYSLPFLKSTEVLFYNKTIFDKYGYEVPKTWDDIVQISESYKLTAEYQNNVNNKLKTTGFVADSLYNLFVVMSKQWGSDLSSFNKKGVSEFSFNNISSKSAMKFFKQNCDKSNFAIPDYFGENYGSEPFKRGQCIMTIGSSAGAIYNSPTDGSFEVGVTTYPQKDINEPYVSQSGTNLSLLKCSDPQEELAGWLFIKFVANFESSLHLSTRTSYTPIRTDVMDSDEYQEHISGIYIDKNENKVENPNLTQKAQQIVCLQRDWIYAYPAVSYDRNENNIFYSLVHTILYGNKSVDDAYDEAMKNLKDLV